MARDARRDRSNAVASSELPADPEAAPCLLTSGGVDIHDISPLVSFAGPLA